MNMAGAFNTSAFFQAISICQNRRGARRFSRHIGRRGSAGFQTCCIADFQIGEACKQARSKGLELSDTADSQVFAALDAARTRCGISGMKPRGLLGLSLRRAFWLFWFCVLFLGLPLQAAEEIPALRPPRGLLPPSFWDQHGWQMIATVGVVIGAIALWFWLLRGPQPEAALPSDATARRALEALRDHNEDTALAVEVSRIVRGYVREVLILQSDELTTEELLKKVRACFQGSPALLATLGSFLRECDTRKFSPVALPSQGPMVIRALQLIASIEAHRHPTPPAATAEAVAATTTSPTA